MINTNHVMVTWCHRAKNRFRLVLLACCGSGTKRGASLVTVDVLADR